MIEFEKVSFSYDGERPVLDQVSFSIGKGESVGLIGANGAGKSTILKLLLGLLSGQGSITVAGKNMCRENLAVIRQKTGFVLQDSDNQMFIDRKSVV